jgi:hypothetical protein
MMLKWAISNGQLAISNYLHCYNNVSEINE